ncbi:MAG: S8 family serine peptidase [Desulfuromonadaceae bacterium]
MKQTWAIMAVVLSMILVTTGIGLGAQPVPGAAYKSGEIIIKYREGREGAGAALHQRHGSQRIREFKAYGLEQVEIRSGQSVQDAITAFEADPDVAYAEPNYVFHTMVVPYDPYWGNLWGMVKISTPAAWDNGTGSQAVVIGTIDTGVDYTHPDLSANIWTGTDGSHGYNAIAGTYDPKDDNGHGTHVAGTIGAVGNNGVGVAGVNWSVKIMACKFLNARGSGYTTDAVECLNYFRVQRAAGVNIIATNNSWGGGGYSQALYDVINAERDMLFIAAAGNSGTDNDTTASYPASYDLPNVVAVAATDSNDLLASWSQYGRRTVDIAAPGVNIYSTLPNSSYAYYSGTSMATPHVTGLTGLIKATYPDADWRTIKNLILSSGDDVPSLVDKTITGKRINAYSTLNCTDSRVLSAIQYPKNITVGTPATLSALSINCGSPSGPVTVTLSGGEVFILNDAGVAPDLAAGDGIFTATFTPVRSSESFVFLSPAGSETIAAPLAITTTSLPAATRNVPYSTTLAASGGTTPYTWSISSGKLPAGLSLAGSTGVISGSPTKIGTSKFKIMVRDNKGTMVTKNLSITVK